MSAPWLEEWRLSAGDAYIEIEPIDIDGIAQRGPMWVRRDEDEQVARIQLAAAAPDLYRELEKCVACIEQMREWCLRQNDAKHATEHCHDVVAEAQNALRKARGE